MTEQWYVCDSSPSATTLVNVVRELSPESTPVQVESLSQVRGLLRNNTKGRASVLVGPEAFEVTPINVAAALAQASLCEQVVLAAHMPSGSLRSRAARAGISRVIDLSSLCQTSKNQGLAPKPIPREQPSPHTERGPWSVPLAPGLEELPQLEFDDLEEPEDTPTKQLVAPSSEQVKPTAPPALACPLLMVASGRGGAGKSLCAASMALSCASWGMKVALVDLDLGQGNLHALLSLGESSDLASVVEHGVLVSSRVPSVGIEVNDHLTLFGPCKEPELAETLTPHISSLLAELSQSYDLLLVDSSTTWTDAVAQAAQLCSRLILVHDTRHGGVASLAKISGLAHRLGVASTRIVRIDNFAQDPTKTEPQLHHAETGVEPLHRFAAPDDGELFRQLVDEGSLATLEPSEFDCLQAFSHLAAQLLGELGSLPNTPEAQAALTATPTLHRKGLLSFLRR